MKIKILSMLFLTLGLLTNANASNKYTVEAQEYMSFMDKTEKDTNHTTVEIKNIDSMLAFERKNGELAYEREDGAIGATTDMRNFYNYQVVTEDGSIYLYNKESCYINPYVKQIKIIKRKEWGYFLMPIDKDGIISEPKDCSAVKQISDKMSKLLDSAIERNY